MKSKLIFIFGLIVAAQVAVLLVAYVFIRTDDPKEKADASKASGGIPPVADPAVVKPGAVAPATTVPNTSKTPSATGPIRNPTQKPGFGTPLNYKNAVQGDIASIPGAAHVKSGILVDLDSRQVLWAKNSKTAGAIASMTKIMTCLLAYEAVQAKPEMLDAPATISAAAAGQGGSQIFLDTRENITLRELIKTAMIKSANDSAYAIAETIGGGNAAAFIQRMNQRAKELNLNSMKFFGPHGLPGATAAQDNVSNPEDLVLLSERLMEFPECVKFASTPIDRLKREVGKNDETLLSSTNHLVKDKFPGVNGLKTGFTARAAFCITATCERNGHRLVAVVMGVPNRVERDNFTKKLLDWGYTKIGGGDVKAETAAPPPAKPQPPKH